MTQSIINRLTPATIHKIAAGEVIERPANAVKELLENALDARATKITIAVEAGGMDLIRVSDNGVGMTREDARLAWLPHTTSKIRDAEDLSHVSSYGFRGEALCSMAAVAELTVETRHASEETGIGVTVSESRETGTREITRNPGTTVTVRNLFQHSPVRRKFMGSGKNETARILAMVSRIALSHPGTGFKLLDGSREILSLGEGSLKQRTGEIMGFNVTNDLLPVQWSDGSFHLEGFISTAQQSRLRASHQYFYVNRRGIHSGLVSRALSQSYDVLPPGRFPIAVLFLTLPPEEVDVNVHPTKKEVRFLNEGRVFWALSQAVQLALRKAVMAPELDLETQAAPASRVPASGLAPPFEYREAEIVAEPDAAIPPPDKQIRLFPEWRPRSELPGGDLLVGQGDPAGRGMPAGQSVPYLQLHQGFILFGVQSGLMLVNQQAAHERILYDKALEELRQPGRFSSQQLLFPEVVEFTPVESRFLEEHLQKVQALGFDLEAFGGNTFQLRGLPMDVKPDQARKVLYEMVQGLLRPERGAHGDEEFLPRLAKVYARVTAIKLGESLDYARVAALVDNLFATQNPYVSPGGAPIVVRFTLAEIRRKFGLPEPTQG